MTGDFVDRAPELRQLESALVPHAPDGARPAADQVVSRSQLFEAILGLIEHLAE